ncbi:unnamed protein product, partial [Anisakis simplex]|uniref:AA_permease domain-containing protein n=1 Tax=Anisakis simplex TaxID=6269 RepID=A0A0M3JL70_ANISI
MGETAWFHLTKEETLPVLSAVGTFAVILLIGYVLNYATSSVTSSERRARYGTSAQIDEYRPSLFTRIARAAMRMGETAWFHLTKEETLPVLSAVGTFAVILLIGYVLNYATSNVTSSERRARYSASAQ